MKILSGDNSVDLWNAINKIKKWKTKLAVYTLACRCQEMEDKIEKLEKRINDLEGINTDELPKNVYYSLECDNFYSMTKNQGMGTDFYNKWQSRWEEFPKETIRESER